MTDTREDHWRYFSKDGEYKSKIHALRWYVYTKEKEDLIKRELLVEFPHPKGGNILWTGVKDNTIDEKYQYKDIELHGFDYKLFE